MGAPWAGHESWELVDEASEAAGRDVGHLLLDADADELRHTRNAQLATFVTSLVALDALERTGVEPAVLAGHSLGEYSALVAAGVVAFDDGVRLVAARGDAMQDAADDRPGTMAAVLGLDDDEVAVACARADGEAWVANYNAPGQVVIAGEAAALERAGAVAKELGAKKVLPLPVGGAFHTPYMAPARDRLRKALAETDIRDAERPIFANVDARPHTSGEAWRELLSAQLCSPVRWRHALHAMAEAGTATFVEIGPGAALTGMVKRTVRSARHATVSTPDDLDALLELLTVEAAADVGVHEGEHLFATERVVVTPLAGVFAPVASLAPGQVVHAGDVVGSVSGTEVRSPFSGSVVGVLAVEGERVTASQPLAWMRTA